MGQTGLEEYIKSFYSCLKAHPQLCPLCIIPLVTFQQGKPDFLGKTHSTFSFKSPVFKILIFEKEADLHYMKPREEQSLRATLHFKAVLSCVEAFKRTRKHCKLQDCITQQHFTHVIVFHEELHAYGLYKPPFNTV